MVINAIAVEIFHSKTNQRAASVAENKPMCALMLWVLNYLQHISASSELLCYLRANTNNMSVISRVMAQAPAHRAEDSLSYIKELHSLCFCRKVTIWRTLHPTHT